MSGWVCSICGAYWTQVDGKDPQTHIKGCPSIRPGDLVRPKASSQESSRPS